MRGYFPLGQTSGGLLTGWNKLLPNTALSEQRLRKLARDFARCVHASARKNKIPLRYFVIGDKTKHAQAEKLRPLDAKFRGVFAIFVAKAPALVCQARNNDAGEIVLRRGKNWPLTCAKLRGKSLVDGLAKRAATECDGTVSGRWRRFGSCASK